MASKFEFMVSLLDKASGPADRISAAVGGMTGKLEAATGGTSKLGKAVLVLTGALRVLQIASTAVDLVRAFGGLDKIKAGFARAGEAVAGFGRNVWAALKRAGPWLAGGAAAGGGIWAVGKAFAAATPLIAGASLALGGFALVGGLASVAITGLIAKLAVGFGTRLAETASTLEQTHFALEKLTGSSEAAGAALQGSLDLANKLGSNVLETMTGVHKLMASGFGAGEARELFAGMADLSAVNPNANPDAIVRAISQIKNTGKLQGDELLQLADASVSVDNIYKNLEKRLGKTRDEVLKLQEAGKIGARDAIDSIKDSIRELTGADLGEVAAEKSWNTVSGVWKRIKNAPDTLFVDLAQRLGDSFQGALPALKEVARFLDPNSSEMSKGLAVLTTLTTGLGNAFMRHWDTMKTVADNFAAAFINTLANVIRGIGALKRQFGDTALGTIQWADVLPRVADGLGKLVAIGIVLSTAITGLIVGVFGFGAALSGMVMQAVEAAGKLAGAGLDWATNLIDGFVQGIKSLVPRAIEAVVGFAGSVKEAFTGKQGIDAHSPSRVFEQYGEWSVQGYQQGLSGLGLSIPAPSMSLGAALVGGAAAASRGPVTVHVTNNITATGSAQENASEINRVTVSSLGPALEQLLAEI